MNVPGTWRDKIVYLKVNIIDPTHTGSASEITGALSYGGMTISRTPIVPLPQIGSRLTLPTSALQQSLNRYRSGPDPDSGLVETETYTQFTDLPGEFITAPFRHFVPTFNFDGQTRNIDKLFQASNVQTATAPIAYWHTALHDTIAQNPTTVSDPLPSDFQIDDFAELSVVATDWSLFIPFSGKLSSGDLSKIKDIEILVRHRAPPETPRLSSIITNSHHISSTC